MSELTKISDVMMCAFELVISRDGDVDTGDGSFATCGTDEIIRLDEAMAHYFKVGSDDVGLCNVDLILRKARELDASQELIARQEDQIKMLRDALEFVRPDIYYNKSGDEICAGGNFLIDNNGNADNEAMQQIHEALEATKPDKE